MRLLSKKFLIGDKLRALHRQKIEIGGRILIHMHAAISELNRHETEINRLRTELAAIAREKEEWLGKAELLKKDISITIQKIKEAKRNRDSLTASVRSLKEELKKTDEKLAELIVKYNAASSEKEAAIKKAGIRKPAAALKKEIEEKELRIETEVISFEEEKRIMRELKRKKQELAEQKKLAPLLEEEKKLLKETGDAKRQINSLKNSIRAEAAESQKHHEEMLTGIKNLHELKTRAKDAFWKCSSLKKSFYETNTKLKEKLTGISKLKAGLDTQREARRKEEERRKEALLEEKEKELKEKMAKGKKLTTKDLLVFQTKV